MEPEELNALPAGIRVALAHDSFTQWGGAERVAAVMHSMFPAAPIFTLAVDPRVLPAEMRDADMRPSFAQGLPGMPSLQAYRRFVPVLPVAASWLSIRGFDLVISSSSSFAHGMRAPGDKHLAYVHNTMRFAWDYELYVADFGWPPAVQALGRTGAGLLRAWDRGAGQRPSRILANSTTVADRIAARWGRRCSVVPPPVDLAGLRPGPERGRRHFCMVTRLIPYKRVDLAIAAANLGREPLVIVGEGQDLPRLKALAGPTVEFAGALSEQAKNAVLAEAIALLVPGVEDFGIAPVEANAAGTPVVATAAGGVLDSQVDGVTAVLVRDPTPETFLAAMRSVRERVWDRPRIASVAEAFSVPSFRRRLFAEARALVTGREGLEGCA